MKRIVTVTAMVMVASAVASDLVVNTTCGSVRGTQIPASDGTLLDVWLSIPYADAPVGQLRWRPPPPITCWNETRNATSFGDACVQPWGGGSEDCLTLSVYTQAASRANSNAPVVVYIHGGSLMSGSGIYEHPENFVARTGVVVVTINYRLNVFGWLAVEEMPAHEPANFGLLDQIAALQWVQANIAAFGGDPARVTVAGQSSGGTSIYALLSSPRVKGSIFAGIAMSGSPNISITLAAAQKQNAGILPALGCTQGTPAERLACARAAPVTELVGVIPASWNTPGLWGLPTTPNGMNFSGLPVVDGIVITHSFKDAMAAGLVDVPLIIGNMAQENDAGPDVRVKGYTQEQWQAYLNTTFAAWPPAADGSSAGQMVYTHYQNASMQDPQLAYDDINTDYGTTCAHVNVTVDAARGRYTSPLYVFLNTWAPATPIPAGGGYVIQYAFHTWDFTCVWENWDRIPYTPAASDLAHARLLQAAWVSLVTTGRVSVPGEAWLPVNGVAGWPAHYGIYVISNPGVAPSLPSRMVLDEHTRQCAFLVSTLGLDERYWWCN